MKYKIIELINEIENNTNTTSNVRKEILKIFEEFEKKIKELKDEAIWSVGEDDKYQGQYDGEAIAYGKVLKLLNHE